MQADVIPSRIVRSDVPGRLPTVTRVFGEVTATLRSPRVSDSAAWAAARHAADAALRPSFDTGEVEWEEAQSELAFVERCLRFRRPMRKGLAIPGILLVSGPGSDGPVVMGELGIDSVDARTGTGEFSIWSQSWPKAARVMGWGIAVMTAHAFAMPTPLRRLVAPQPVPAAATFRSLPALGWAEEVTLSNSRRYKREWAAHRIWVLHNTVEARKTAETWASSAE